MTRSFVLKRDEDVSGVSGTGIVAEGIEFSDGTVALRWTSEWPTSVVFHDRGIEAVRKVHGHDGRTQIVWHNHHVEALEQVRDRAQDLIWNDLVDAFAAVQLQDEIDATREIPGRSTTPEEPE